MLNKAVALYPVSMKGYSFKTAFPVVMVLQIQQEEETTNLSVAHFQLLFQDLRTLRCPSFVLHTWYLLAEHLAGGNVTRLAQ